MTEDLQPRHVQVLRLVAAGLSDREVGERLGISEGAARNVLYRANKILGGHTRTRAAVLAYELGLLDEEAA